MAYKFQIGEAQLSGALRQEGTIIAEEKLTVLADGAEITGAVGMSSTLDVAGAADLASTLAVAGISRFQAKVEITGAADLSSTLDVAGAADLASTLAVAGVATLTSGLTASAESQMRAIMPAATRTFDIGAASDRWASVYAEDFNASGDISVVGAVSAAELSGALEYNLDNSVTGGLELSSQYDNTANIKIGLKNADNFSDDTFQIWDDTAKQFYDSGLSEGPAALVLTTCLHLVCLILVVVLISVVLLTLLIS